ncbi:MAG: hypothetical protein GF329_11900 [Candidatus Lokiarchaeota archaeon]|nr:hypothetical protein [Candidatus Lokiarchaeota archaeon]
MEQVVKNNNLSNGLQKSVIKYILKMLILTILQAMMFFIATFIVSREHLLPPCVDLF